MSRKKIRVNHESGVRPFFQKHPRLRHFICNHPTTSDIGTFKAWNGKEVVVCQCDYCGMIRIGSEVNWFPLPEEFNQVGR